MIIRKFLLCLLSLSFCYSFSDEYTELTQWMISHGAYINPKLTPVEGDDTNRYIITSESIKRKEEILFVPNELVISIINRQISPICRKIFGYSDDNDYNCIVFYMLMDKYNKKSFFNPYYNYLPKFNYENLPLYFTQEFLDKYKITGIGEETSIGHRYLDSAYEAMRKSLPNMITFEDFKEVFEMVATRNFGRRGSIFPEINSMVPYLDLFNHVNEFNSYYYYNDKRDGFVLFAVRDINKGDEITVSYGSHNNMYLFSVYGFTLKNNKFKSTIHVKIMGDTYSLVGDIKEDEIKIIQNRLKERNKVNYKDGLKEIKKILLLRLSELNALESDNYNIINILEELKDTVIKYLSVVNRLLEGYK